MMKINKIVNIIGAGFAGIESALFLASHDIKVHIFDIGENYKCDMSSCELLYKNNENSHFARDILRSELKFLESPLINIEEKFHKNGLVECGCLSSRLLEESRKLINNNKNIQVFKALVNEIDIDEPTLIATGPHSQGQLFDWLKKQYGSMRCQDGLYESPVLDSVDENLLFKKEDDNSDDLYYPFDYDEYLKFVNRIVKAHNDFLDFTGAKKVESGINSIEKLIEQGKDALKTQALRPCKLLGYNDRPYAVLKIKKVPLGFELCGLYSSMPKILQDMVFTSLKPFKNSKLIKVAQIKQNLFINSPYVINEFMQSIKNPHIFFAGGITGCQGHLEAMASGLMASYSILCQFYGKNFVSLPYGSVIGSLSRKIISSNAFPCLATCDIIEGNKEKSYSEEFKKDVLIRSKESLSYYLEEVYGRSKI